MNHLLDLPLACTGHGLMDKKKLLLFSFVSRVTEVDPVPYIATTFPWYRLPPLVMSMPVLLSVLPLMGRLAVRIWGPILAGELNRMAPLLRYEGASMEVLCPPELR